jgi:hypothetical protein
MVVEKHYIGNKVEFRQYPPLVDKFLQYARTTCPHVIHKLWIRCGQVVLAYCRNLSTSGGYCRNSTLFPIICFSTTIVSYIYKLVGCTACITLFFHGTIAEFVIRLRVTDTSQLFVKKYLYIWSLDEKRTCKCI